MIRLTFLVVLLLFSCKTNTSVHERESKVTFKILNDTIFDKDTIRLEIYNQENKTIFIPIDFNWKDSYLSTDGHQRNYFPNFILQKQDSIFSPLLLMRTIHGQFTANYPTFLTS